jgi:hypothetical protein
MLFFTVLILGGSQFLIPRYGYNGAAAAALFATVTYNVVKLFFIKSKMGIQPFTTGTVKVLLLAIITYAAVYFIPNPPSENLVWVLTDMLIRSVIVTVIFGGGILLSRVSDDISMGFSLGWTMVKSSISRKK